MNAGGAAGDAPRARGVSDERDGARAIVPPLAELFPDDDYAFRLTLRRAEPAAFFEPMDPTGNVRRERARWLEENPRRYAGLHPEGEALLPEFVQLASGWAGAGTVGSADGLAPGRSVEPKRGADAVLLRMGRVFEPAILLLSPDDAGRFRLRGGVLCFPTGWALEEKIGLTLDEIHGIVPGLNPALGAQIHQFLAKLKPGVAYLRHNWGLAATDELNLHPARGLPAPEPPVRLDRLWLRVEHQALLALPATGGIVFGIRISLHRLDAVAEGPAREGLRRALETMPVDLAVYKRLDAVRLIVSRLL